MKKKLLVVLLITAVLIYTYNTFIIVRGTNFGVKKIKNDSGNASFSGSSSRGYVNLAPVVFENKGRDPFNLYSEKPKKTPEKQRTPIVKESKTVPAPQIAITGILWNPGNPIATVKLPEGKTALVKEGQKLEKNLIIKRIEKKNLVVVYEGKEFVVNKK